MKSNKGAVSVLLCVIFISIVLVIGAAVDVSSLSVANAYAKRMNYMACNSVLAEYDRHLYEDYGLIAYNCSMGDIETKVSEYLNRMKRVRRDSGDELILFDVELDSIKVSCRENLRNEEVFTKQVKEIMKFRMIEAGTDKLLGLINKGISISEVFQNAEEGLDEEKKGGLWAENVASYDEFFKAEYLSWNPKKDNWKFEKAKVDTEDELSEPESERDDSESETVDENADSRRRNVEVNTAEFNAEDNSEDRILRSQRVIDSLPSGNDLSDGAAGGFGFGSEDDILKLARESAGFLEMLNSALDAGEERIALMGYARLYLKNAVSYEEFKRDSFFKNETEYVLKGKLSDKSNRSAVKRDIFLLRTALNIAYLYSDSEKRSLTLEAATALGAGPYAPAVQFLIVTAWAGAEATEDVRTLYDGGRVPFFKDDESWMLDLDSIFSEGVRINGGYKGNKGLGYSDYLQILLFTCSRQVMTERIMDIIQINMKGRYDIQFDLRNCITGFSEEAQFKRISRIPEVLPGIVEDNFMEVKGEFAY